MSPAKLVVALAVLVLLCFVALGFAARGDQSSIGDPNDSAFGVIAGLAPQHDLAAKDVHVSCFSAADKRFTLAGGGACASTIPDGVKRVQLRWDRSAGGLLTVRVIKPGDFTQHYEATDKPQDPHPDDVDIPVLGNGSQLELDCAGTTSCTATLR